MRKSTVALGILLAALLVPPRASAFGGIGNFDQAGNPLDCDKRGRVDTGWGFSVQVPESFSGCRPDSHGLLIPLASRRDDRLIGFSGFYNASGEESATQSIQAFIDFMLSDLNYDWIVLLSREPTSLSGLDAERVAFRYKEKTSQIGLILVFVEALSRTRSSWDPTIPAFSYSAWMVSTPQQYEHDRGIFERTIATWRLEEAAR